MLRKSLFKALGAGLAIIAAGWGANAAAQTTTCGITGSASAQAAVYDPFNPTGLVATNVTINLTRVNNSGGGDTRVVNFYLRANPSQGATLNGTTITPISVAGSVLYEGLGLDIFYDTTEASPAVLPKELSPSAGNKFLKINFTGNNAASNTAAVTFAVTLPANLNITASTQLSFDAFFGCNVQGGSGNGNDQQGSFANAVSFPITVLSALRASYVGTALEFGEIGTITNVTAPTINTGNSNYVRVQSSGPYNVTLQSANAFRLKHPSGSLAVPAERVPYTLRFLGVDRNNASHPGLNAVAITQNCLRAGVPASEADELYIRATLEEGGQGKTPSPNYTDQLIVTVTPLAGSPASPAGATGCPALPFP
jgi:hypothetical protein